MKTSAFTGWQIYNLVSSMFKGKKEKQSMNYLEYTEAMGLLNDKEKKHLTAIKDINRVMQQQQATQNIGKAGKIVDLFRSGKKGG